MIAVDTHLLVYAHRRDSSFHAPARSAIAKLAEGNAARAIPWPCLHEFHAIVIHPRIYTPPSTPEQSVAQMEAWLASPTLHVIAENELHWQGMRELIIKGKIQGPLVHDARIVALCLSHGVHELWSADRDLSRFPRLRLRNPLLAT